MKQREHELDFIRVTAMAMIVICHIFSEAGVLWGQYFNAGVMVFLFLSGMLACRPKYGGKWIAARFKRILPEYYIFVILFLFVTVIFFHAEYSIKQILVNLFLLQGIFTDSGLPNINHLWFVTCILICYLLTPLFARLKNKLTGLQLILLAVVLQILIIPLRFIGIKLIFSRFVAYFAGVYFSDRRPADEKVFDYRRYVNVMALPVIIINAVRFVFELSGLQERLPKVLEMGTSVVWQWAHMFLGIFLFYLLWLAGRAVMPACGRRGTVVFMRLSAISYCVYIVHQVFVYHEYALTRYISPYFLALIVALICIAVSALILYWLSNAVRSGIDKLTRRKA